MSGIQSKSTNIEKKTKIGKFFKKREKTQELRKTSERGRRTGGENISDKHCAFISAGEETEL